LGLFENLFLLFTKIIETGGYVGVFILMTLESMVAPVPSEAVMPFAGFLVYSNTFSMPWVIIASTIGSIVGSLISYYIGLWGGKPVVLKFGKYLLLDKHHLEITEKFFAKYGEKTIFICRFIPVVRHLISIPAGVGKMNVVKFSMYTVIGAAIWNAILAYLGLWLGEKWSLIHHYSRYLDYIVVVVIIGVVAYWILKRIKNKSIPKNQNDY
jgi:membrane protein DedA with SNARE-associated domain